jgi:putative SOS response-associated peptidase YedK
MKNTPRMESFPELPLGKRPDPIKFFDDFSWRSFIAMVWPVPDRDVKGETIPSFAILTDEPTELVAPYHDRMPVVLGEVEPWLDLDTTLDDLRPLGRGNSRYGRSIQP